MAEAREAAKLSLDNNLHRQAFFAVGKRGGSGSPAGISCTDGGNLSEDECRSGAG
jgi:hypothetical protein